MPPPPILQMDHYKEKKKNTEVLLTYPYIAQIVNFITFNSKIDLIFQNLGEKFDYDAIITQHVNLIQYGKPKLYSPL